MINNNKDGTVKLIKDNLIDQQINEYQEQPFQQLTQLLLCQHQRQSIDFYKSKLNKIRQKMYQESLQLQDFYDLSKFKEKIQAIKLVFCKKVQNLNQDLVDTQSCLYDIISTLKSQYSNLKTKIKIQQQQKSKQINSKLFNLEETISQSFKKQQIQTIRLSKQINQNFKIIKRQTNLTFKQLKNSQKSFTQTFQTFKNGLMNRINTQQKRILDFQQSIFHQISQITNKVQYTLKKY